MNSGVIFQFNPSSCTYTKKIDLDGSISGMQPSSGLHLAIDTNFYGNTFAGGSNSNDVIYRYEPLTNIKLHDFDNNSGSSPAFRLTESNNKLYGVTFAG